MPACLVPPVGSDLLATGDARRRGHAAGATYRRRVHIEHTALIVENYDDAIRFFVDALGFDLVEDSPATTNDGRPKRWVVVRPPEAQTGLLLAEADGEQQVDAIGRQYAGRVGLFLRVDDFEAARRRMLDHGVEFVTEPRDEPYGRVAVFLDLSGNRWDLLGPPQIADGPAQRPLDPKFVGG